MLTGHTWHIYKSQPLLAYFNYLFRTMIIFFIVLRLKRPSCQSAEDLETQATLTTMKRRTSMCHKQKSVQKSLLTSSAWARVPSGLTCFGIFALSWGLRWNRGHHMFKTNASFLHSTQLNEVLLAMILRAVSTNLYTGTLCRHPSCCNTKILDHVFIFCLFFFSSVLLRLPPLNSLLQSYFNSVYYLKRNVKSKMMPIFKWRKEWLIVLAGIARIVI